MECDGDNSECLVEFMNGLNYEKRALETIVWLNENQNLDEEFKYSFIEYCNLILENLRNNQNQ